MTGGRANSLLRTASFVLAARLVLACGGQTHPVQTMSDTSDDGGPRFPHCSLNEGRSWKFTGFHFLDATFSHDFGDGVARNALAVLADPSLDSALNSQIHDISVAFAAHIDGFTGTAPPADLAPNSMITMELIQDRSRPPVTGQYDLCADPEQFNVDCTSASHSSTVVVEDGSIHALADPISIVARTFGAGAIALRYADLLFQPEPIWDDMVLLMSEVWPVCSMASVNGPDNKSSFLDFVTSKGAQPDVSLDGNGLANARLHTLPVFRTDDNGFVSSCQIGDETIDGADCPCDPSIKAGYSGILRIASQPVTVVQLCDE
jgi:hypothetical protein